MVLHRHPCRTRSAIVPLVVWDNDAYRRSWARCRCIPILETRHRPPSEDPDGGSVRKEAIMNGGDAHPLLGIPHCGAKIIPEMATEREDSGG